MGLDMYLRGIKTIDEEERFEDGFKVVRINLSLGYWRKRHSLHKYIVSKFYKGSRDANLEQIDLEASMLRDILEALAQNKIENDWFAKERDEDIEIFSKALQWIEAAPFAREIYYYADF